MSNGGYIGYYGLTSWWAGLTDTDKTTIQNIFNPMGIPGVTLTSGNIDYIGGSVLMFLADLSGWFEKTPHLPIAVKIIEKGEELVTHETSIKDKNYFYAVMSGIYNKLNKHIPSEDTLQKCIYACEQQVAIAPEVKAQYGNRVISHEGYELLINIRLDQGNKEEAERLVSKAINEGWAGRWERLLEDDEED